MNNSIILQIAVPLPFRKLYDYLPLDTTSSDELKPGIRVKIPFGNSIKIGVLMNTKSHSDIPANKLKPVLAYLDHEPIINPPHLEWLKWISQYYHHPIGETLFTALPVLLRKDKSIKIKEDWLWQLSPKTSAQVIDELKRAPKQQALLNFFLQQQHPVNQKTLNEKFHNWRATIKGLEQKGWIEKIKLQSQSQPPIDKQTPLTVKPNSEQQTAIDVINQKLDQFSVFLLNGVTGSGKTEVYLNNITSVIKNEQQVLVLIPEIGLTPQLLKRFKQRFDDQSIATLHSNMNDNERYQVWLNAKNNKIKILIGTRSAIFTPMPKLGLIIIDEEHDLSFKQQEGLRYSARDIALTRAQRSKIPIVLGSATPSFESLLNVKRNAFTEIRLKQRAGASKSPAIKTINIKGHKLTDNFSPTLIQMVKQHLSRDEQVMVFLNRRGYAPTMICQECGWIGMCARCDHPMTIHAQKQRIICHHCGNEKRMPNQCPECSSIDLRPRGYGTERTEHVLSELFPDIEIIRIDRDTTSRKNAMHNLLDKINTNHAQILLGTQMLAKGHDFPNVTLVAILDADQGLFGVDLRASERMAQLITQVAGRAGRGNKAGRVVIQTQHPDHPLLTSLIEQGYLQFSLNALKEREMAQLPPYSHASLIRAESNDVRHNINFLMEIKNKFLQLNYAGVETLGPAPSPLERKAGRYRSQLLIISNQRKQLHIALNHILQFMEACKSAKKVRWNIDVDPMDMS